MAKSGRAAAPKANKQPLAKDKPTLGATAKAHVQKLNKIGVEDPRKFFLAGKEEGMTWQGIKGAGTKYASGGTGKRISSILGNDLYTADDGGKLQQGFNDQNLVGSHNHITQFDGSEFSGGGFSTEGEGGGGGGTGSSAAGRESVGLVGDTKGQSIEEVVYGVKKRGKKVSRARGE